MHKFTESILEEAVLDYLFSLGWQVAFELEIAIGEPIAERND
jgi:hypothetical protein